MKNKNCQEWKRFPMELQNFLHVHMLNWSAQDSHHLFGLQVEKKMWEKRE